MTDYAAGWYPQPDGRLRYYNGQQWTDHFAPGPGASTEPERGHDAHSRRAAISTATSAAAGRLVRTSTEIPQDAIWSAVGKPISGIGAGRYWLTAHYLFFERGTLRTDSQQVPIAAVVDVDTSQTMSQKARGVFTVLVHIHRATGIEKVPMVDIPEGREAQRQINEAAHRARAAITQHQHTQTIRHEGSVPAWPMATSPTASAVPPVSTDDPMATLERLGKLRDAGVVTEEEFTRKKAEILKRL